ncbi:MAG: hypothetical protein KDD82_27010 [Planctomycetes bacterium]|nr:hypothetical protein [Planctomycetota bacterium]
MNAPTCYAAGRPRVCTALFGAALLALGACGGPPPVASVRAQGPHMVRLGQHRVLIRPRGTLAVQVTYLQEADLPTWELAWPAYAPVTRLRLADDDGELALALVDEQGEPEQVHAFAVNAAPRGRLLGIDLAPSADGSYSLSQVLGSAAPIASASFGAVETLSTVRVGGR